ncbi:MAG: molybdopterin molybdotransferase MoeA [Oscillospiraceae bacterium]|nr:molybdopterin molybdotransferase MoeA [Oscillospiraceae bacterium]
MQKDLNTDAACNLLYSQEVKLAKQTSAIGDALGRVVATDTKARIPYPPFDRSPFDGYALKAQDTKNATSDSPAVFKIIEELPAGTQPRCSITSGHAAKILTGAPIPIGANTTIRYEDTLFTDSEVRIFAPVKENSNLVFAGVDIKPGEILASQGTVITAPIISSLTNQGYASIEVFKKPVISVISTGSELCEVGQPLKPATIYNSNVHTLCAYLTDVGAAAINGGTVPDHPDVIATRIDEAFCKSDMVITTGGASVGSYDWAVSASEQIGAKVLFWKASMRPGGAIVVAIKDGKVILGLSGNPAAAVIGLLRIAMPYIKKLCGRTDCFYPEVNVTLREPLLKSNPKMRILRGKLEIVNSIAYFSPIDGQGSEIVSSLEKCDLLGEVPQNAPPLPAGSIIKAYRI